MTWSALLSPLWEEWNWRILLLRLFVALIVLGLLWILRELWQCRRWRQGSPARRNRKESKRPCGQISGTVYRRPDPLIYSQKWLMSQGLAVTWDNPDIHLELAGVPVPPHSLKPDTVYEIVARIWNGSTSAPAIDMPVRFAYIDFGIGGIHVPIGETRVDLPAKGAAGHPAFTQISWRTPNTPGHYCLLVDLIWADDANPNNNLGQTNLDVRPLNSPSAAFTFPIRNESQRPRTLTLRPDAYVPPPPPDCRQRSPGTQSSLTRAELIALDETARRLHGRDRFPIPEGWQVRLTPRDIRLAPGQTTDVLVDITAPDGFGATQALNVNAFEGDQLVGGVTLQVHG
jgi:hypothetical protein